MVTLWPSVRLAPFSERLMLGVVAALRIADDLGEGPRLIKFEA